MVTEHRTLEQETKSGSFHFYVDNIKGPVYISFNAGKGSNNRPNELLKLYIAEPGDSIDIRYNNKAQLNFSGKGSPKYECRYRLDSVTENVNNYFLSDHAKYDDFKKKNYLNFEKTTLSQIDSLLIAQLSLLGSYRNVLSEQVYQLLEADLLGKSVQSKYACYTLMERDTRSNGIADNDQRNIVAMYKTFTQSVNRQKINVPDTLLALSKDYIKSRIQLTMAAERQYSILTIDTMIRQNYSGLLKDKLLAVYLIENFDFIPSADSVLALTIQQIQTLYCKEPLVSIQNRLSNGSPAYNFVMEDSNGKYKRLSDYLGKTVFLDFWYTGCAGCVQLYKNVLTEIENVYRNDSTIVFISVSIDTDKDTWLASIRSENYTSDKGINLSTGKIGMGHPIINRYGVSFFPTTFLIDKNGKVVRNTSSVRSKDALLAILEENFK